MQHNYWSSSNSNVVLYFALQSWHTFSCAIKALFWTQFGRFGGKNILCEICKQKFCSTVVLKNHKLTIHNIKKVKKKNVERYQCDTCDKNYTKISSLNKHSQKHHNHKIKFKRKKATNYENVTYKCQLCGKGIETKQALEIHMKSSHKGVKHICKTCDKEFSREDVFRNHNQKFH